MFLDMCVVLAVVSFTAKYNNSNGDDMERRDRTLEDRGESFLDTLPRSYSIWPMCESR